MTDRIATIADLEAAIGKTPPAMHLKVIDHLDAGALRWIAAAPLAFVGLGAGRTVAITLAGGTPGFAQADAQTLRLPLALLDDPASVRADLACGMLFLAPGIGETLRVNGRVAAVADGEATVAVEECYVHCAKALIRSEFWSAAPLRHPPGSPEAFVAATRFVALATIDAAGRADLSPKGDPAGCMTRLDQGRLWFAERPGNRRADSYRNIIAQPRVAAALLIPGAAAVAIVTGAAHLTADAAARAAFTVRGKLPALAAGFDDLAIALRPSPALARARLWPLDAAAQGIDPAQMLGAHVRLNKDKGLGARIAGALVSIPGLMQKGLDKDYKSNLY